MTLFDYVLYGLTVFAWSSSWLPLKWQLGVVAPEVSLVWRFGIAAVLMIMVTKWYGHSLRLSLRAHGLIALLGVALFSFNFSMFYYGGLYTTSGLLAVIFSTSSMINIVMISVIERKRPQRAQVIAAAMGFSGVCLIFLPEIKQSPASLIGMFLCLLGAVSFCSGNMISGALQRSGVSVMSANSWGMIYGTCYLTIVSLIRGHSFIIEPNLRYIGSLLWLSVVASALAFTCYLMLVGRIGAGKASYATVLFPVGALLISTVAEGYVWSLFAFVGLFLVVSGNAIMARSR